MNNKPTLQVLTNQSGKRQLRPAFISLSGAATAAFVLAVSPAARAADKYWDRDGVAAGLQSGGATWSTGTTATWSTDPAGTALTTFAANDNIFFQAASSVAYISNITAGATVTAGTVTVDNTNSVTLKSSGASTAVLSSTNMTVKGASTLRVRADSFTLNGSPSLTIEAGSIFEYVGQNSPNIRNTTFGAVTLGSGNNIFRTTADAGGVGIAVNFPSLTGDSGDSIVLARNTDTLTVNNASGNTSSFGGIVSGPGKLTKNGLGALTLSGANTYAGATTISGGTLVGVVGGSCANSAVTVSNTAGSTLGVAVSDNTKQWTCAALDTAGASASLAFVFSTTPSPTLAPLNVTGNLTFTGVPSITVDPANLVAGQSYPLMTCGGTAPSGTPSVTIGGGLTGLTSWSGNTLYLNVLSAGSLPIKWNVNGDGIWDTSTPNWIDSTPAATTYSDGGFIGDAVVIDETPGSAAKVITLNSTFKPASVTVDNPNGAVTISGTGGISGGGSVTKTGSGTLTLSTANTYTGLTTVSNGTFTLGHPSDTLVGDITISGGTLDVDNPDTMGALTLTSGTISGDSTLTGSSYSVASGTVSAVLGGSAAMTKTTAGTVTLSGANTYTGLTTVSNGTMTLGNASDTLVGGITVNGGTLDVDNPDTVGAVTLTSGTISGDSTLTGSSYSVASGTINAALGGTAAMTKTSTGAVTLSGDNSFSGGFTLGNTTANSSETDTATAGSAGFVYVGHNNALGTGKVTARGAQLRASTAGIVLTNAFDLDSGSLRLGGANDFGLSGNLVLLGNRGITVAGSTRTVTISGIISGDTGTRGLNKEGTGTLVLTGTNTYGGFTGILGGTLTLSNSLALQNSYLNLATGASVTGTPTDGLKTTVTTLTIGGLAGNQDLASVFTTTSGGYSGVTDLTLNVAGNQNYTGAIADGATGMILTKTGAGTQTLGGANTYTGATTISQGTLALGNSNVLPDASNISLAAATLNAATFTDTVGALDVTAAATINLGTGAALAFADSSAVDWTGGTLAITGTFVSGSSLRFGTGPNALTDDQLLKISATGFSGFDLDANGYLIAGAGYASWASLNGAGVNLNDDHDNDGVSNGIEYFIGGTTLPAANTTGYTALPGITPGTPLSVTWTKAGTYSGSYNAGFVVQTSDTLGAWSTAATSLTPNVPDTVYINGNNVTYTFPTGGKKFARLSVTGP